MQICNIKVSMEFGSTLCSNEHHLSSSENEARKKNSGLYKIWTHDLHGAVLYQLCNIQDINHAY